MTRLKGTCERCGKLVANSKLMGLPGLNERLCCLCRKRELNNRNKPIQPEINNIMSKSLNKQRSLVRPSKFLYNRLSRDEDMVLNLKHKHDSFKSGKTSCFQLRNLKKTLNDNKILIIKSDNNIEIDRIQDIENQKKLNKDLTDGLK